MRTSKISQETTRLLTALSSPSSRRPTRSSAAVVALGPRSNGKGYTRTEGTTSTPTKKKQIEQGVKQEVEDDEGGLDLSGTTAVNTPDIEDTFTTTVSRSTSTRKRKRENEEESVPVAVKSTVTKKEESWTPTSRRSSRRNLGSSVKTKSSQDDDDKSLVKKEEGSEEDEADPQSISTSPSKARRQPARKTTSPSGTVTIHPPSNWQEMYNIVKAQRRANPTAPVDTMGCEDLYWPSAPPKERRYHILCSLMLSSQTKDTVTSVAMQRLHTELIPRSKDDEDKSVLTVENMLAVDPKHLDELIGKVGFHNNKTRYLKSVAQILRAQYSDDIPADLAGLLALPGVGPKMAYLCLSAAWSLDLGIGVDVHVHRITNLWGWHKTKTPEETRGWLESWLPKECWHEINKLLVGLGQTVCLPVGRRCWDCSLAGTGLCKAEIRGLKVKEEKQTLEIKKRGNVVKEEDGRVKIKEELANA